MVEYRSICKNHHEQIIIQYDFFKKELPLILAETLFLKKALAPHQEPAKTLGHPFDY